MDAARSTLVYIKAATEASRSSGPAPWAGNRLRQRVFRTGVERPDCQGNPADEPSDGPLRPGSPALGHPAPPERYEEVRLNDLPSRLCGSGLDALGTPARATKAGDAGLMIAGGAESMSRAPFVAPKLESVFSRANAVYDTAIGWRLVNKLMMER